ncbi:MAG: filamentous hemagglutinin N-terminal domain-containing protein, partial [Okeania sp. SIO3B5]|uniref:two-partner secretion domain-containing protein n=1 Tax=Okeania sp. SIO3B5 TaxID=2607811 RepID=UPI001400D085
MKTNKLESYSILPLSLILFSFTAAPASSQPITPANDGTGTTVTPQGNQFNIEGGTRNGANLFHSFDQFNVNSGQTANFLTTPDTRNILGRVTGGNASIINGLIQVTGGNSNLFLMNPAGIMFGPNASLNIPASFSVTTATGIGFNENNFWFQAMGTNDYSNLVGNPSGYRFDVSNPGAIVNQGNLSLNPGENLTLLGGTVINTGQLSTAGGNITIAAVEGNSTLRISQPGHLLSLDVPSTVDNNVENSNLTPLSLPELLTGGEATHASDIIVNANGDVVLIDSNTVVAGVSGDAIASGNIDVSTTSPLGNGSNIGGQVNVLGDRVALIDANINADGLKVGGTVLIGGDFQGNGIVPNSQQTFVNQNSIISADSITNGNGGQVIIWSDGITNFAGNISARGGEFSGDGGFVEVSGKQQLIFDGNVDVSAAFGTPGTILLDPEDIIVGESENTESSETETVDDNSEVASGENSDSSTTENTESSETETVDDNSEVVSGENSDSPTTENTESSETETVDNNLEVVSGENIEENVDNSEVIENTNSDTEIADNSETTETLIDPFEPEENSIDVTISAENIGELSGDIILFADNDITINEKIETTESVELKAGRSININADIDTSIGNGNIDLLGNNDEMNIANRNAGAASINQLDGTTLNAGSGRINIELGNLGEVGDINLANLTTTGQVLVDANGGNIARVSDSSIINAGSALFQTNGSGGIGLIDAPLQLNVENLEAVSGSGGAFFDVGNVNIGDVSEDVDGIVTAGGDIDIKSDGNVTLTETISTIETVENNSEAEISPPSQEGLGGIEAVEATENTEVTDTNNSEAEISPPSQGGLGGIEAVEATENTEVTDTSGSINIEATGDIVATGSGIKGGGESVSLSATNIRINDEFDETSGDADVKLEATNDITVEDIEDDVLEFLPGGGEIEFRADVDGDGVGVVEMLDNEADVGSDPNTFENGADTIKTNGRSLTIAGAGIVLGNIDTSRLPVFYSDEFLAAIDVDEGGLIPAEDQGGIVTLTFTLDSKLGTIENLDVRFSEEDNNNKRQLEVFLKSPTGEELELFAGADFEQIFVDADLERIFQNTAIGDNASTRSNPSKTSFDSMFPNQKILADLNRENPNGIWTLRVTDTAPSRTTIGTQLLLRQPTTLVGGGGNGGAINLEATDRDIRVGNIRSLSETADGGRINLTANNNIITGLINSSSIQGIGGDINLNTISGNILTYSLDSNGLVGGGNTTIIAGGNMTIASVNSSSSDGDGGAIALDAGGDITTASLYSPSFSFASNSGNGGEISLEAGGDIKTESLNSYFSSSIGNSGNGGEISLEAGGNITTKSLYSYSSSSIGNSGNGGSISLEAGGDINNTESLYSYSFTSVGNSGDGGAISLEAGGDINNTESLYSPSFTFAGNSGNGGDISLEAGGNIATESLYSLSFTFAGVPGNGGTISLDAGGDITTELLDSSSYSDVGNLGNGGDISLEAGGNITTKSFSSYSFSRVGNSGNGGDISLEAGGNITTENLFSSSLSFEDNSGNGGAISLEAGGDITTKLLNSDSNSFDGNSGNGGAISLEAGGDITRVAIKTFSVGKNDSGDGGDVNITTNNLSNVEILTLSSHSLSGDVTIESQPQGNLQLNDSSIITSKQVTIEYPFGYEIQVGVGTQGQSGNLSILSSGNLNLNNVNIESDTKGEKNAGNVNIYSLGNITLNNTDILSTTNGQGNAGEISLEATQNILLTNNSKLQASTETTGSGNAGDIKINTGSLTVTNGAEISANTGSNSIDASNKGNGIGGNIRIEATEIVNLDNDGRLSVETRGAGKAGNIEIYSPEVNVTTNSLISADARQEATNREAGGNITINTNTLNISSSEIFAQTKGETPAGTITLKPYNNNSGLNINFTNEGTISASTQSTGEGGNILIAAPETIDIVGNGRIVAGSNGAGKAGNIEINSQQLTIAENARIRVSTIEKSTNTEGGTISINANTINLFSSESSESQSEISAETESKTSGGTITLKPYEENSDIEINFSNDSRISARTLSTATGNAGNINISAPEKVKISGDGKISAENSGAGRGGDITIEATESIDLRNLEISAESTPTSTGNAGEIRIETQELTIADGARINASTKGTGNAGVINIDTQTFTLETGTSLTTETESAGKAGDITINSERLTIGKDAEISATAKEGATNTEAGGNITINANDVLISGLLGIFAETAGDSPAGTLTFNPYRSMGRGGDTERGRHGEGETRRGGDAERGRRGEGETRRGGDAERGRRGEGEISEEHTSELQSP